MNVQDVTEKFLFKNLFLPQRKKAVQEAIKIP